MAKTNYSQDRKSLCALLVQAREKATLTQKQVSDTGIVSQSELSKIEKRKRMLLFANFLSVK